MGAYGKLVCIMYVEDLAGWQMLGEEGSHICAPPGDHAYILDIQIYTKWLNCFKNI